ncbi:DNA-binding MarR family transcriptional regulator [Microbacterium sp. SLBN-154]|uniref:MarR family winged helix-turn-helix transcriptional regulator n=1 Tax=Microbacterium sp. SLBN-154 TaxID=2768458 RepID=UPI00114E7C92|nr:MarR family winged helix-turn-helix transcriptional regulator [Microbacterium sp. SLBN-154]TQK17717.1 DNA-binding MarR family transcriptional regulator [Microbacterium sp. SLBN-154]
MTLRPLPGFTEEESLTWLTLVRATMWVPAFLDHRLRATSGINHFDYALVATLRDQPGQAMPLTDLAEVTGGELSRLSHGIKRLSERGWVQRRADPNDARVTLAMLTPAGHAAVINATAEYVAIVRELMLDQTTTEEREELRVLLTPIIARANPRLRSRR